MADSSGLWVGRIQRLKENLQHEVEDLERALSWHIGGGKKHYIDQAKNIIQQHKWCFIVGCNNSGTSVLQTLLERSGKISTLPREGQHYSKVLTRGHRKGFERVWSEFIDDVLMGDQIDDLKVARLVHDWMRSMPKPVQPIIVEKTTLNAVRMHWLQKAFPNSCFIGLVRNGYSVSEGIMRKGNKDVTRAARHWNLVNKIMLEDAKSTNKFLLVRYEQLVGQPEATAERIADFLDIDRSSLIKTLDGGFGFETLEGKKEQKLTDFDQKSIAKLSDSDLKIISHEAREMLDHFGY